MNATERLGCMILSGVLLFFAAIIVVYAMILPTQSLYNDPNAHWTRVALAPIPGLGALFGLVPAVEWLWKGREGVRWLLFVVLFLLGAAIIGTAFWMTTLDYPNAETPAARAEMQASDRQELPGRVGLGLAPLAVASLLLLPAVGRF